MAESKTETHTGRSQDTRERSLAQQNQGRGMRRWDPAFTNPFEFMERMSDEMDRWFDRVTRNVGFPRAGAFRGLTGGHREGLWFPKIEAFQKGDRFVVRADLPGLKKDDVNVELTDDAITIRGERHEEKQEEREGFWRSEREYGQFHRTIPLPEGVIGESAEATFNNGVLEITMQAAPEEANRGRKVEIKERSGSEQKK